MFGRGGALTARSFEAARRSAMPLMRQMRERPPTKRSRVFSRLTPVSDRWGFDRGLPIDRYYIEAFLGARAHDIRGAVLEVGDRAYTSRFGADRVNRSEVLHVDSSNPNATI